MYEEECSICEFCTYEETNQDSEPCNSCLQWVDGYLTAVNFDNKYFNKKESTLSRLLRRDKF
jgi:hypothetical protein